MTNDDDDYSQASFDSQISSDEEKRRNQITSSKLTDDQAGKK
jgi:hypothetical protein